MQAGLTRRSISSSFAIQLLFLLTQRCCAFYYNFIFSFFKSAAVPV
jgi:hypothetical protein